jgi:hypothetical protein
MQGLEAQKLQGPDDAHNKPLKIPSVVPIQQALAYPAFFNIKSELFQELRMTFNEHTAITISCNSVPQLERTLGHPLSWAKIVNFTMKN